MRALLDVNVLIALMDEKHDFHERAHLWWQAHAGEGWASCPLTENGFIRIVSQISRRLEPAVTPGVLAEQRAVFRRQTDHPFWPDDISITDSSLFWFDRLRGPKQVTDIYLLGLAVKHRGSFATFDGGVPLAAVLAAKPGTPGGDLTHARRGITAQANPERVPARAERGTRNPQRRRTGTGSHDRRQRGGNPRSMKTELVQTLAGSDRFVGVGKTIHLPKGLTNGHFPDCGKMVIQTSATDHFVGVNKMVGGGQPSAPVRSANGAVSYQPGATPQVRVHSLQQGPTARPIPATMRSGTNRLASGMGRAFSPRFVSPCVPGALPQAGMAAHRWCWGTRAARDREQTIAGNVAEILEA